MKKLILALAFFASPLFAADYYASPTGSGTTCSIVSPCTLSYLMGNKVLPGDNVWLRAGTYVPTPANDFTTKNGIGGSAGNYITYRNYQNEEAIIDCNSDMSTSGFATNACFGSHGNSTAGVGEYIRFWGLKIINSHTGTRFNERGFVDVVNGSPNITFSGTPGSRYQANPTATVDTNGTAVTWTAGTIFVTGSSWNTKDIRINGVTYVVSSVTDTTHLTLTSSAGVQSGVATTLPGNWSNLTFTIDPQGTPAAHVISYCASVTSCTLKTNVTKATGTYIAQYPQYGEFFPARMNSVSVANKHNELINCLLLDPNGGTNMSGAYGGNLLLYGNVSMYAGAVGTVRSMGHGGYYQNLNPPGEAGRSWVIDNVIVRPFDLGIQMYSTSTDVSYITFQGNSVLAPGHGKTPTEAWPATGQPVSGPNLYLGTSGSVSTGCPPSEGGTGSTKTLTGAIVDSNFVYGPTAAAFNLGGSKGSCKTTITNNYFINSVQGPLLQGATFPPLTISGNTFMFGTDTICSGPGAVNCGGPAPLFTKANFPSNTFLSAIPTSGADVIMYRKNQYETGRGKADVFNPDGSATATIDVIQMGGYVGEQYKIFNAQDPDYWDSTPIATGTCAADPCNVVVPMTCTGSCVIHRMTWTGLDLVTPFLAAPDLGPTVATFLLIPNWGTATTPTPTNTPSPTFTNTPSRTPTFTPSLTATNTPSNTPTPTFTQTPTGTITPSASPTRTPSPTFTASMTPTFTPSRTPTITPTPSTINNTSFAFSQCPVTSPMVLTTGVSDFPGSYVSSPTTGQGLVTCTFSVSTAGTYRVWLKTYGLDFGHDSFYIDVDGDGEPTCDTDGDSGCPHIFDNAEQIQPCENQQGQFCNSTNSWAKVWWNPLNDRTAQSCGLCTGSFAIERRLTLSAGTHTIKFRQRDPDARLYYAILTTDLNFTPSDPPSATPTPGSGRCPAGMCPAEIRCNGRPGRICVPCGGGRHPDPCPWPK